MEFNLEPETRCDFFVDATRKKIWKIQLDMLQELIKVCDQNRIQMFGIAGTMLGAVRHKGFIPWDDDIDIAMYREDFDRFVEIATTKNVFKFPYFLQTSKNDNEHYGTNVRLRHSLSTAVIDYDRHKKCNNGIYIDIFPLDGVAPTKAKQKTQYFKLRTLHALMREDKNPTPNGGTAQKLIRLISKFYFKIFDFNKTVDQYQSIAKKYSNPDAIYVDHITRPITPQYDCRYTWPKYYIEKIIYVDFENIKLPIPAEYDLCLKCNYKDYMELPPVEKRGLHHAEKVLFDPDTPYEEFQKNRGWI